MSHHLDSPIARQDVRLDITDLYVFRGETGTAFVIDVWHRSRTTRRFPAFTPKASTSSKSTCNGDAVEELTYRVTFGERDSAGIQRYEVRRLTDPESAGTVIAEGATE